MARLLKLVLVEEDGTLSYTYVAVWPICEDCDDPEDAGEFFKQYIVQEWEGLCGSG